MKKIILLMVVSFFILGCQTTLSEDNFRKGFPVMSVDVIDIKGYEDYQFNLKVLVHNILGYNVENVEVSVVGLDESYVELFSDKESIDFIEGRSQLSKDGEKEVIDFEGTVMDLPEGIKKEIENKYRIYLKYDSELVLFEQVCIPPSDDLYSGINNRQNEKCKVERGQKNPLNRGENRLAGQGAPIGFTNTDIIFRDQNVELRLNIENEKDGEVGGIILYSASLGGKPLTCNFKTTEMNKNQIKFDSDKKEITLICKGVVSRSSYSYTTPLLVELSYDYEFSVQKELLMSE